MIKTKVWFFGKILAINCDQYTIVKEKWVQ